MRETNRSQKTKEKFKKAFFALYSERKIETITIKEVADLAGFNRGTFYLYYKSIYDLLQKTEQELIENITERVNFYVKFYFNITEIQDDKIFEDMEANFLKNNEYINILNGENGDPRFKTRMKNTIKDAYRKYIITDNTNISKFEYLLEYFVEANISIMQYYFINREKDSLKISLKEIKELMDCVNLYGFKKAFEDLYNKS